MSARHLHLSFLVLVGAVATAHADAITDFRAGTAVMVENATVDLGNGPRSSSGSGVIAKAAGSLDFALRAADLGVDLPITIHLRGSVLRNGWLALAVDETYSPPVDLGGGYGLAGVTGRLYMRATPLPGSARHEAGNTRWQIADASFLVAHGEWGRVTIAITELDLQGGVPQPPLAGFADTSTSRICSDRVATYRAFTVWLSDVARASGASVELTAPRDGGVRLPGGTVVRAGSRSATVVARIDPGFAGTVRLTAAAGGVARSLDVVVYAPGACGRR